MSTLIKLGKLVGWFLIVWTSVTTLWTVADAITQPNGILGGPIDVFRVLMGQLLGLCIGVGQGLILLFLIDLRERHTHRVN